MRAGEQLIKTRDKAGDISTLAEQAKSIVRGIQARAITNKLILGATALLLFAAVGGMVALIILKKNNSTPPKP
jgi:hypothetical protein